MLQIFREIYFRVAKVKLLHSLRLFEFILFKYCSAGVTELYPILKHCETKPFFNTLPNYSPSYYITELYHILVH